MGKTFQGIDERLARWITEQPMFFVGSAPLAADAHVNVSPKGPIDTLQVIDEHTVAYLDLVGSGAETVAHVRENGRIVIMLCAFQGRPRIVRLHGRAEVLPAEDARFEQLLSEHAFFEPAVGAARRAIVLVQLLRVADSCGYGVPLMSVQGERPHMEVWAQKKLRSGGDQAMRDYQRQKNSESIDGLPAIELAPSSRS